ncbi:hypothetical protein [Enterobacter mori]|uniref:hypothetical protein n=1 Tax=Enterobacter mori TaxID=539813 RepID=UPI001B8B301B|nr:hypothetical protein [Enterobacter mori]MBS3049196.1 hypothetical protein [Enterobacter mori]
MNINPSVVSPLKTLTQTYNWLSDKTKTLGGFVGAKILGVSNKNEKMPAAEQAGKQWKICPEKRSMVFALAKLEIRVIGQTYTPPKQNLFVETKNGSEWKNDPQQRQKIYEAAKSQVFGMGDRGIRILVDQPKCITASLNKF